MKRKIGLMLLFPLLFLSALAQAAPISITVYQPTTNTISAGQLLVYALVYSEQAVTVEISVDGLQKRALQAGPNFFYINEDIDIRPLSKGAHLLSIRITDSNTNRAEVFIPFIFNDFPTLTVRSPFDQQYVSANVLIDASATDPDGDVLISASLRDKNGDRIIATGTNSLRATIEPLFSTLTIAATDPLGATTSVVRQLWATTNKTWTVEANVAGRIRDADSQRLLYETDTSVVVGDRAGNILQQAARGSTNNPISGYLTPHGAIYLEDPGLLYELDSSGRQLIATNANQFRKRGNYAVYVTYSNNIPSLYLRDLLARTSTFVSTNLALYYSDDASPTGQAVYWSRRTGTEQIYANNTFIAEGSCPRTDGTNIVFVRHAYVDGRFHGTNTICVYDGVRVHDISAPYNTIDWDMGPFPDTSYMIENGWVAFKSNGSIMRRSSTGQISTVTDLINSSLKALAPNGDVLWLDASNRLFRNNQMLGVADVPLTFIVVDGELRALSGSALLSPNGPALSVRLSLGKSVVSWTDIPGYSLQMTTNLTPANWKPVNPAAILSNGNQRETHYFLNQSGFFRLAP
jgi:hypothetical protein